jgi:iron transport multicopper oxidase
MNEAQNVQFPVFPGKTYLFHIINMGAMAAHYLQFDQHMMTVVEVDGVWTQPYNTNQLFIAAAQRYSVLITMKADKSQNFAIVSSINTQMFAEQFQAGSVTTVSKPASSSRYSR